MKPPSETTREQIRQLRQRHGWSQQDLTDALNRFGAHTERSAIARVEIGERQLSIDEAFRYALALDVAPVHLFVPTDSDESMSIGPNVECTPAEMRAWIRGERNLPEQDSRIYHSAVPREDFKMSGSVAYESHTVDGEETP